MRALSRLIVANIRSFVRDRSALFWTIAFPLIFVLLFGSLFSDSNTTRSIGFADEDGSAQSAGLKAAFSSQPGVKVVEDSRADLVEQMQKGDLTTVIVVPAGFGQALDGETRSAPRPPVDLIVYTDPSQSQTRGASLQLVGAAVAQLNQAASGRPPAVVMNEESIQTEDLSFISYIVPSILGMSLMQLGVFAAIPLVADREKLILKRLQATPVRRWQLVGSNVVMRLLIAVVQTIVLVGVGVAVFGVEVIGSWLAIAFFVVLGSLTFISLGYVIASFAPTEESANSMTSVVQFPLMFLSGIFFPIAAMPDFLQGVARLMPLTYLGDALRQVMVGGVPFAPLPVDMAVLGGWLVACLLIAGRFFRWQ
jgi:ABC-2 type transport system permease protein